MPSGPPRPATTNEHRHSNSGPLTPPSTHRTTDRMKVPLHSLTPRVCLLWTNSTLEERRTNPLHVAHKLQITVTPASTASGCATPAATCCTSATGGTPGAPCGTTGGKRANSCVSKPTTKSSDPEPERHPHPEQPPLPNQHSHWHHPPTELTGSPTQYAHSVPHSLPTPPEVHDHDLGPRPPALPPALPPRPLCRHASSTAPSRATTSRSSVHLTAWTRT
ncbi:unnamed protein product [Microthlaspi erraticum]|uniref:Uncharacterized protein n=1 Tax=Microthlaspi erraticum TaxID=1685480 RepID=A0A6D2HM23_9BRAS|nr:unnamed protein product [Microthlaspi erraticum]